MQILRPHYTILHGLNNLVYFIAFGVYIYIYIYINYVCIYICYMSKQTKLFCFSTLCLHEGEEEDHFPVHSTPAPIMAKSAPVTPTTQVAGSMNVGYRECRHGGFFEGLLGCLRPMWTIIGKATSTELKQQSECQFHL